MLRETSFRRFRRPAAFCAAGLAVCAALAVWVVKEHRRRQVDFARDVQPILSENCLKCHGPEKQKGGLRLDRKDVALKSSESGETAVVPGDSARSGLVRRITSSDADERMPPKGDRLPPAKVELLRRWIGEGAPWPETVSAATAASQPSGMRVTEKDRQHWAFRPLAKVTVPEVRDSAWALTPLDHFILAAQEAQGLHPNPPAPRRTLIRRLYFDLIGLPPAPEEIDAFEHDDSPGAYERLVDRLLANPHYGERWGRHWLDSARYADSAGYEEDRPRPNAYPYRDFVIRAFNDDLPYDRFVHWQLAGDLLAPENPEALAATGFITAAPDVRPDFINFRKKDRCDELDDIVATTGSAILGLTLGCARCHDHKFDPVPVTDYYRLTAFFTSTERQDRPLDSKRGPELEQQQADFEKRLKEAEKKRKKFIDRERTALHKTKVEALPLGADEKALLLAAKDEFNKRQQELEKRFEDKLDFDDTVLHDSLSGSDRETWDALDKSIKDLEAARPAPIPTTLAVHEGKPQKSYLLVRGDPDHQSQEVTPGTLTVLTPPGAAAPATRADLATWLTDERHGAGALAARVIVNRLWQHHFGRGLVDPPNDFGIRSNPPTHPEMLDWLSAELIRNGWHLKPLQKLIVMSAVYRQDIAEDSARAAIDPANRTWWRREPERIEAEILRDSILSVSGDLNPRLFGPAVKPRIDAEAITITNPAKKYDEWPKDVTDGPETWRRSIYVFIKRANLFPFLKAFDAPNAIGSCTRRSSTTVAPQALALLNDQFVRDQARAFASRLSSLSVLDTRVESAFELALGRKAAPEEITASLQFIAAQASDYRTAAAPQPETAAFTDFCQGLLASNEFSYID